MARRPPLDVGGGFLYNRERKKEGGHCMSYQVLAMDIDGTLRPFGASAIPPRTLAALQAVQRAGVRVVAATGRGRVSVPPGLFGRLRPDAWLCAAGAEVLDASGRLLSAHRMTAEEMYALVDFFEDYDYPLRFQFADGNYVYVNYAACLARHRSHPSGVRLYYGEDQDRHLQDMPYSAFGILPQAAAAQFGQKYGHLGLRFLFHNQTDCDIMPAGVDKAAALAALLESWGVPPAACVAVGDSDNDAAMLRMAGLGVCVADGTPAARAAAGRLCAPAAQAGVADLCRELWPAAFAPAE